ncbi:MAG: tryptophan-rich sensory protein [Reyranella sp.]|jgi:benzodiazapine receptor|nr:MAG: tryptophan-rich sensory protein [Reyranella sp.]
MSGRRPDLTTGGDLLALTVLVGICLLVGALGAGVTATSIDTWYAGLAKPSFNPLREAFGPIWTVLYIVMAIAAWRVWRSADLDTTRGPLTLFALQLALNLGWIVAFFGMRDIGFSVGVILVLDLAVLATAWQFRRVDGAAALLLVPYLGWLAFATVLHIAIWRLN